MKERERRTLLSHLDCTRARFFWFVGSLLDRYIEQRPPFLTRASAREFFTDDNF
ncbi:hypothetical protein OCAR_7638 [Afipia carboxidovorans OM5]|nr:hypothetical protein OCAR_7638 [Afipia carboxidovorans OM5]